MTANKQDVTYMTFDQWHHLVQDTLWRSNKSDLRSAWEAALALSQQAEPVAWMLSKGTDVRFTCMRESAGGYAASGYKKTPLYATPPDERASTEDPLGRALAYSKSARNAALEEAAQVCDEWYATGRTQFSLAMEWSGATLGQRIRALQAKE